MSFNGATYSAISDSLSCNRGRTPNQAKAKTGSVP